MLYSKILLFFLSLLSPEEVKVERLFQSLNEEEKVAQMIVTATGKLGKSKKEVLALLQKHKIGGILLLNGEKEEFKQYVKEFDKIMAESKAIPLLYSADAEPSLLNYKIKNTRIIKATSLIRDTAECKQIAHNISEELLEIGIRHNFAPVCDLSTRNVAIGNRSFGNDTLKVKALSEMFIDASRGKGIMATAKHFPGHGYVKGDTHKQLVYIEGELKELGIYKHLISKDVPCIMVGHIAVRNNLKYGTKGLPATCSRVIVTDLLRNELNFQGLIITDAMNMGAVVKVANASLEAIKAGCDMILMPENEEKLIGEVLALMAKDEGFKAQIYESVKRILRYKVALGVL